MCTAIALKLCTWLVVIDLFLAELCPLNLVILRDFTVFRTFFSVLTDINLASGSLLCHTEIQIKFEFGLDPLVFPEVIALGLRKRL
jgi:hypothetical protein